MNFKKILAFLLCLTLIFSCTLPLASCKKDDDPSSDGKTPGGNIVGNGGNGNGTTTTPTGKTNYTIKVETVGGMPLEGVYIYVHKGNADFSPVGFAQPTDANGTVTFELDTADDYSIQLYSGVPNGYTYLSGSTRAERYPMGTTGAKIVLGSKPITTGGFAKSYNLGDVMYDFTLTDVYGNTYNLSEMLKTKKAVMLNFWFVGCTYCEQEFPSLNAAYKRYSDKIEVLAINDHAGEYDSVDSVIAYPDNIGVDLQMPLFRIDPNSNSLLRSLFPYEGYPTTVIIDRYGVITMIEPGALIGENKWDRIFQHFTADDYDQKLITDASVLTPIIEPTISWTDTSEEEIANAFNKGEINVHYYPELKEPDAKYSWPFVATTFGKGEDAISCIKPTNSFQDNSYSILYADVTLKPGQAIAFDYYSSTQKGADALFVLVDGKDIYSISGDSIQDGWSTCVSFVDPRQVKDSNKDEERTYQLAFAYYKDDYENYGDDTVYLKDLRIISTEEIETETYIFRYAATDKNTAGNGYNSYVDIMLDDKGFYRVGTVDGPYLLANLLSYSLFDSFATVSARVYVNHELFVNMCCCSSENCKFKDYDYTPVCPECGAVTEMKDVNMFLQWVTYGNAAANSQIDGFTAVTYDLARMLQAYCDTYADTVGKEKVDNLWLQLCVYYDAYGKKENGEKAHLENPVIGLIDLCAYDVVIKDDAKYDEPGYVIAEGTITYNRGIMPKGYLYKFVPEVSGVYRVTSISDSQEVNGWIFVGNSKEWAENEGDRLVLASYDVGERHCQELLVDPDGDGIYERDFINATMVAYMEAGVPYYIDLAYYDVSTTGTFDFEVKWLGESYDHYFIQASPGPITAELNSSGGIGQLIAAGITPIFTNAVICTNDSCIELVGYTETSDAICARCGTKVNVNEAEKKNEKYAFNLLGYADKNNTVPIIGSVIYADFYMPTTCFPSQSIQALLIANAFNLTITELDREALQIIDGLRIDGRDEFIKNIMNPLLEGAEEQAKLDAEAYWEELGMDAAVQDKAEDGRYDGEYTEQMKIYIEYVIANGKNKLIEYFTNDFYTKAENAAKAKAEAQWANLEMDAVIRYGLAHANVKVSEYGLTLDFTGGDDFTGKQISWAQQAISASLSYLNQLWGESFKDKWTALDMNKVIKHGLANATITEVVIDETKTYLANLDFSGTAYSSEQIHAATSVANLALEALGKIWAEDSLVKNSAFTDIWTGYAMNEVIGFGLYHDFGESYVFNAAVNETNYTVVLDYAGSGFKTEQTALAQETINIGLKALRSEWGENFLTNWAYYQITSIINESTNVTSSNYGIFHNTDDRSDRDIKAQGYLAYLEEMGVEELMKYWDTEFPDVNPVDDRSLSERRFEYLWLFFQMDADEKSEDAAKYLDYLDKNGKDALMLLWDTEFEHIKFEDAVEEGLDADILAKMTSMRRYNYLWEYYMMDDVKAGHFHGKVGNYTSIIEKYVAIMDNDINNPERQGCVAVTEELAEVLHIMIDHYVFEYVKNDWLKFCYYYNYLRA